MSAGFGHTYDVYNNRYAALAFSTFEGCLWDVGYDLELEMLRADLADALSNLDTVSVTFKGRVFDVRLTIESTYNGDDLCVVPNNLWDAYAEVIENATQEYDAINWQAVAQHEDALQAAFELALCDVVFTEFPQMLVRKRILGWCGTAYKPVTDYILDLKSNNLTI